MNSECFPYAHPGTAQSLREDLSSLPALAAGRSDIPISGTPFFRQLQSRHALTPDSMQCLSQTPFRRPHGHSAFTASGKTKIKRVVVDSLGGAGNNRAGIELPGPVGTGQLQGHFDFYIARMFSGVTFIVTKVAGS